MPTPFMGTSSGLVSSKRMRTALTVGVASVALGLVGTGTYALASHDSAPVEAPVRAPARVVIDSPSSIEIDSSERALSSHPAIGDRPASPATDLNAGLVAGSEVAALDAARIRSSAPAIIATQSAELEAAPAAIRTATPAAAGPARQVASAAPAERNASGGPAAATPATTGPPAPVVAATPAPVVAVTPAPAASSTLNARGQAFLASLNEERVAAGLPAFTAAADLNAVASTRAWDMVSNGYFAHVSPTGTSWLTVLQDQGVRVRGGGENLARVSGDPQRSVGIAVEHLMESPTHRANILAQAFDEVGIAAVTTDDGVTVFVTIFATR